MNVDKLGASHTDHTASAWPVSWQIGLQSQIPADWPHSNLLYSLWLLRPWTVRRRDHRLRGVHLRDRVDRPLLWHPDRSVVGVVGCQQPHAAADLAKSSRLRVGVWATSVSVKNNWAGVHLSMRKSWLCGPGIRSGDPEETRWKDLTQSQETSLQSCHSWKDPPQTKDYWAGVVPQDHCPGLVVCGHRVGGFHGKYSIPWRPGSDPELCRLLDKWPQQSHPLGILIYSPVNREPLAQLVGSIIVRVRIMGLECQCMWALRNGSCQYHRQLLSSLSDLGPYWAVSFLSSPLHPEPFAPVRRSKVWRLMIKLSFHHPWGQKGVTKLLWVTATQSARILAVLITSVPPLPPPPLLS